MPKCKLRALYYHDFLCSVAPLHTCGALLFFSPLLLKHPESATELNKGDYSLL